VTAVSLIDPLHRLADTRIAVATVRRPFDIEANTRLN
jgi:hypothetical protein